MIEIEKKFIVTEEQTKRLISGAEFLGEKILRNVYYDDVNYSLTSHDLWLRKRNGKFELKIPAQTMHDKTFISQYSELETEEEIRNAFPLPFTGKTLDEDLKEKGFFPFVDYVNTRKKYKKDEFSLDFDDADFSDFHYRMLEIELLVENCEDTKKAVEKILDFAQSHDLSLQKIRGKILEFLRRKRKEHYETLVEKLHLSFDN